MAQAFIEDPPYIKEAKVERVDFLGFALLAVWLGALQVVLDKGQEEDWFASSWMRWMALASGAAFLAFVARQLLIAHPIVDLRVLKNRNFAAGVSLITILGAVLYGTTAALPIFLQTLMGYPALQSGMALSPRGIGAFITTALVGRLVGKVPNRLLLAIGFSLLSITSFWLGHINLQIGMANVVWPSVVNGVAISFIFVPLTTSAMGHLRQEQMGNASGVFNLMRNLGGSIGIALVTTLLARRAQLHQALMVAHLTPFDPGYQETIHNITSALGSDAPAGAAEAIAQSLIYRTLLDQSQLWAFVDNFRLFGVLCLVALPMVMLFKRVRKRGPVVAH
jgi:DHA2 family multidrug resistance protein